MARWCNDRTCGGDDCETCHPGCSRPLKCVGCGDCAERWSVADENYPDRDAETFVCDDCLPFYDPETGEVGDELYVEEDGE